MYAYAVGYCPGHRQYLVAYVDTMRPDTRDPRYREVGHFDDLDDARMIADACNAHEGITPDASATPDYAILAEYHRQAQADPFTAIIRAMLPDPHPLTLPDGMVDPRTQNTSARGIPTDGAHPMARPDLPPHLSRERLRGANTREDVKLSRRILDQLAGLNLDPSA